MSAPVALLASQHLTESRYIAGLQSLRRPRLLVHEPLPYEEPAPDSRLDVGQEISGKAYPLFAGRAQVHQEPWQHAEAAARTATLMSDKRIPAIFETTFECDSTRARVDVPISGKVTDP